MNLNTIAIIDIETTGLDRENDLILEIGVVELNLISGDIKVLFDTLVREPEFGEKFRDAWIFGESDMEYDDICNVPAFNEISHELQVIINNYFVTAFSKDFDFYFLRKRGIEIPNELPCIMKSATDIVQIEVEWGYKWPKVQEAWDFFFPDTDYEEAHRAANDAIHEARILYEMYVRGQFPI